MRTIRRNTFIILGAALLAACLYAGAAATARATTSDDQMRASILALRGLIDREGAARYFQYPSSRAVRPGHLGGGLWPRDPWTGALLQPGTGRGHYTYTVKPNRRRYRLVGHLGGGRSIVLSGGMPRSIKLAYDHRGEEGLNLIRQYVEDYAAGHSGRYPSAAEVGADGAVGTGRYWPSNPWDHGFMRQRRDRGSFSYEVAADRATYTLRLHRALKNDYVLTGARLAGPWRQLLTSLEDEILRRSGRILAGYVTQWALQHGALPAVPEMAPSGAVGLEHADWPLDPISGATVDPGVAPGDYTYTPGTLGAYTLTVHLHSGDFTAGGTTPLTAAPARTSAAPEP